MQVYRTRHMLFGKVAPHVNCFYTVMKDAKESYKNCIKEMFGLRRFGIKLGLDTIRSILDGLGNPQDSYSCIHVAGTNGKGSIASALSSILHLSGYKVGLYTSPHLVSFNERICINDRYITDEDVISAYQTVKSVRHVLREPTFFEFSTAMALYEFQKEGVDWAVIETGMGGRLDATNILKPVLTIISNIAVEHKKYLGNTIAGIAAEKGGIIKENVPVITGARQKSAVSVLKNISEKLSAPFYHFGKDFRVRRGKDGSFTYYGLENVWRNMRPGLLGKHQVDNAALTLASCEILTRDHVTLELQNIKDGLLKTRWPGRLEIVSNSPVIILDGAHNLMAARKLAGFLSKEWGNRKITLVIGILDDKPYAEMLRSILPVCNKLILTSPKIDRSLHPDKLRNIAKEFISDIAIIPDVGKAVSQAVEEAAPEDVICVAGSLYVIGEAKEALEGLIF